MTKVQLDWMEGSWEDELQYRYFVQGQPVTRQEYEEYWAENSHWDKPGVQWLDYTQENLSAVLEGS